MTRMNRTAVFAVMLLAGTSAALAQNIGPSTTVAPYVVPKPGLGAVSTTSIFTVGDTIGGYRLVGIPDGMGAINNGNGTFDLLVNHELGATAGVARAHGSTGAFVSRWNISTNLTGNSGRDHNTSAADVNTWNGAGYTAGTTAYGRFCSADLAAPSAYRFGNLGTDARILLNGEEIGNEGRAFAHVVSGSAVNTSWQLPALGRYSWENAVTSPFPQAKTVVMGLDDQTPGQVYAYVGTKTASGNDIERAGLTNGVKYGIRVPAFAGLTPPDNNENRNSLVGFSGNFELAPLGDVTNSTGLGLQQASEAAGVTEFLRPEDGAWDPRPGKENDFYFVTTDRFNAPPSTPTQVGRSRLWRMSYNDITNPAAGGTLSVLMEGTEGQQMFDNMCIDSHGRIMIQEDPGGQDYLARIWMYDIDSAQYTDIARHNPDFFQPGVSGFLTRDEESSGIIDAKDILGDGWFLLNTQAHYSIPGELVEGGQLMAMYVDPSYIPAPGAMALLGLAGLAAGRRRRA